MDEKEIIEILFNLPDEILEKFLLEKIKPIIKELKRRNITIE